MATISRAEVSSLVKLVQSNSLLNRQLSNICQLSGLPSTGVKAVLQSRIVSKIQEAVNTNDTLLFDTIRGSIQTVFPQGVGPTGAKPHQSYPTPAPTFPVPSAKMPSFDYGNGFSASGGIGGYRQPTSLNNQTDLSFKSSPFYEIRARIGHVRHCDAMSQHRNMITIPLKTQDHILLQQCISDKTMRVMVFCAAEASGVQDIAFPHQSEIKVNGGEIKANLRGLKNKPGSTRPVDITDALRLRQANYTNNVEFTYALTQKKFYLALCICKITPVQDLVQRIRAGRRIAKASVIQEISAKASDPDIVTMSQVLSLKCPITYMRLDLPCRSVKCAHVQCFDATSYLQMQEQGPQWLCPICNNSAPFDQLAVDEYVKDILTNTPKSVDQVTIEPDGKWGLQNAQDENGRRNDGRDVFDDDFVISEVNVVGDRGMVTPSRSLPSIGTPTTTAVSREGSSLPRGPASAKRPAPQVIDLTLSSDEDEDDAPIARPAKRQQLSAPNGYSPAGSFY